MAHSPLLILTLAGSLGLSACDRRGGGPASATEATAQPSRASAQRIDVAVTADGFVPARLRVKVGQPVTLVVTRRVERTCATDLVIKEYGIKQALPQGQAVEVTFTPAKPGIIRFACAMDMIAGELVAD